MEFGYDLSSFDKGGNGGNIPGRTKVLSGVLFDYIKASRWDEASWVAAGMLMFAFAVILTLSLIDKYLGRT